MAHKKLIKPDPSYLDRCCPNPVCPVYGEKGLGNIAFHRRYGKQKQWVLLRCVICGQSFSERQGTFFYDLKLPEEKVLSVLRCLVDGCGIRQTERIAGVHRDTVLRLLKRAAQHVKEVSTYLMQRLHISEVQLDEFWSFIRKKEKNCTELEKLQADYGDCWGHVAFDPQTKLIVAWAFGPRDEGTASLVIEQLKQRTDYTLTGHIPLLFSDGHWPYPEAILREYGRWHIYPRTGRRGRPRSPKLLPPPELNYVQLVKHCRKGRVVSIETCLVYGSWEKVKALLALSPVSHQVNTAFVERNNLSVRHYNRRLARKSQCYSKKRKLLEAQFQLFAGHYHFVKPHGGLRQRLPLPQGRRKYRKRTPAMAAGITDHIWDLKELLTFRVPVALRRRTKRQAA